MPGKNAPPEDELGTSMFEEKYEMFEHMESPLMGGAKSLPNLDRCMPMEKKHQGVGKRWKPKGRK